jgi:hypothetical protein
VAPASGLRVIVHVYEDDEVRGAGACNRPRRRVPAPNDVEMISAAAHIDEVRIARPRRSSNSYTVVISGRFSPW